MKKFESSPAFTTSNTSRDGLIRGSTPRAALEIPPLTEGHQMTNKDIYDKMKKAGKAMMLAHSYGDMKDFEIKREEYREARAAAVAVWLLEVR